jgi:hypothetical protein
MRITVEPLAIGRHLATLHRWVTDPRCSFWGMGKASLAEVDTEYRRIEAHPHHHAHLGRVDGAPAFLAETYDPARSDLAGLVLVPELRPGDLGMHVLIAPTDGEPISGWTTAIFQAVLRFCFADPSVRRVVVEPDVRNRAIRRKNTEAGFVELRELPLPGKTAMLSVCTRQAFAGAAGGGAA